MQEIKKCIFIPRTKYSLTNKQGVKYEEELNNNSDNF